ncbi:cytochrome P450 2C15-like [Tigriopus californicus]|uniref:cytochrome P450 2C15-like n=1 Tax=Tigriopus californicus TaxID=6832 RepID=UPI0027DA38DF|nr:cytochrome P450 2C15-like [Tigriopus californicus]
MLVLIIFVSVLVLYWYFQTKLPDDYPPTPPIRLPILGHAVYLYFGTKASGAEAIDALYQRYSKDGIMAFHLGPFKTVIIGNYELLQQCFKSEETNYRHANQEIVDLAKYVRNSPLGNAGIIEGSDMVWTEQRRFALSTLKDFGFGKASMEILINEELIQFMDYLEEQSQSGPIAVANMFNISVLNILWQIVAGQRFDYHDKALNKLVVMMNEAILSAGIKPSLALIFPFLRTIYPGIDPVVVNSEIMLKVKNFLTDLVLEHKATFDPLNIRDFIDAYLLETSRTINSESSFHESKGNEILLQTLIDLFFAGSETTSSTLTWGIVYLIRNPDIQSNIQQELDDVIGTDRMISLLDRTKLPYLDATILEIQRLGDVVPNGLVHATPNKAIKIGKYIIPTGHMIQGDFSEIMQDQSYWKDARYFKPERHLDDKKRVVVDKRLIPFSMGKRRCPGESLAKSQLFLFLANLLQRFQFLPEKHGIYPSIDCVVGVTKVPLPFKMTIIRRNKCSS